MKTARKRNLIAAARGIPCLAATKPWMWVGVATLFTGGTRQTCEFTK